MVYSKRVSPAALVLLLLASALAAGCGDGAGMTLREAGESVLEAYPIEAPSPPERNRPDRFANLPADAEADSHPVAASRAGPYGSRPASAGKGDKASGPPEGFVDPITRDADRVPITLEGCLRRALVGNLKVQIARFGPAIAETYVVEAEALFDPAWFLNNALGRVRQDAGSFLLGAATLVTKQWEFDTGVETLLPTGGTVALSQDWTYIDSNSAFFMPNPQYDTDLNLEVRQPLLRGAGLEVTKSPIVLARLDHRVSLADSAVPGRPPTSGAGWSGRSPLASAKIPVSRSCWRSAGPSATWRRPRRVSWPPAPPGRQPNRPSGTSGPTWPPAPPWSRTSWRPSAIWPTPRSTKSARRPTTCSPWRNWSAPRARFWSTTTSQSWMGRRPAPPPAPAAEGRDRLGRLPQRPARHRPQAPSNRIP